MHMSTDYDLVKKCSSLKIGHKGRDHKQGEIFFKSGCLPRSNEQTININK